MLLMAVIQSTAIQLAGPSTALGSIQAWMWQSWIQVSCLGVAAMVVDRCLPVAGWHRLRAAMWSLVLLKLVLPVSIASPFGWAFASTSTGVAPPTSNAQATSAVPMLPIALAAGVVLLAVAWIVRSARLRWHVLAISQPLAEGRLHQQACSVAEHLGLRCLPRMRIGIDLGPAVLGVIRPCLLLPAWLEKEPDERVRHVLMHELLHLRRADPARAMVVRALQVMFFWQPFAWLAGRRLSVLREIACDRSVAASLGCRGDAYRRTLLDIAARQRDALGVGLALVRRRSQLVQRLEALAVVGSGRGKLRPVLVHVVVLLPTLVCVPRWQQLEPILEPSRAVCDALVTAEPEFVFPPLSQMQGCVLRRHAFFVAVTDPAAAGHPPHSESAAIQTTHSTERVTK